MPPLPRPLLACGWGVEAAGVRATRLKARGGLHGARLASLRRASRGSLVQGNESAGRKWPEHQHMGRVLSTDLYARFILCVRTVNGTVNRLAMMTATAAECGTMDPFSKNEKSSVGWQAYFGECCASQRPTPAQKPVQAPALEEPPTVSSNLSQTRNRRLTHFSTLCYTMLCQKMPQVYECLLRAVPSSCTPGAVRLRHDPFAVHLSKSPLALEPKREFQHSHSDMPRARGTSSWV